MLSLHNLARDRTPPSTVVNILGNIGKETEFFEVIPFRSVWFSDWCRLTSSARSRGECKIAPAQNPIRCLRACVTNFGKVVRANFCIMFAIKSKISTLEFAIEHPSNRRFIQPTMRSSELRSKRMYLAGAPDRAPSTCVDMHDYDRFYGRVLRVGVLKD